MKASTFIVLMCLLVAATGCGRAAEQVVPAAEHAAREAVPPVRPHVPVPRAEPAPADRTAAVAKRAAELLRTIPYPNGEQRRTVVKSACLLHTLYGWTKITDPAELRKRAILEAGGDVTLGLRAIEFFKELRSSSTEDNIKSVVITKICGM